MDGKTLDFLDRNHTASMITLRPDGTPHAVRVAVGLVDGRLWSSSTPARLRTRHVRRDPRSTLFVFDVSAGASWRWLTLETRVTMLEGIEVPEMSARFFGVLQRDLDPGPRPGHLLWEGTERPMEEFLRIMVEEQRILYEFEVLRSYGMY